MTDKQMDMIEDTLSMLSDKVKKETGEDMLIGWGVSDDEGTTEGCVTSPEMPYGTACKILCGIQWFAINWYGEHGEDT